eukprot:874909_1
MLIFHLWFIVFINVLGATNLVDKGNPISNGQECEGDCDGNAQCSENLLCWEREGNQQQLPPGCEGTATENWDYCYDPNKGTYDLLVYQDSTQCYFDQATIEATGNQGTPSDPCYSNIGTIAQIKDDYRDALTRFTFRLTY